MLSWCGFLSDFLLSYLQGHSFCPMALWVYCRVIYLFLSLGFFLWVGIVINIVFLPCYIIIVFIFGMLNLCYP